MATKHCSCLPKADTLKTGAPNPEESLAGVSGIIKGIQNTDCAGYSFDCEKCPGFRYERIAHGSAALQPYEKAVRIAGGIPLISTVHYKVVDMRQKQLGFELGGFLCRDIEIANGNASVVFTPLDADVADVADDEFFYCGGSYGCQQKRRAPIEAATVERVRSILNKELSLDSLIGNSVDSDVSDIIRRELAGLYFSHRLSLDDFLLSITPAEDYAEISRARNIMRSAQIDERHFMTPLTLGRLVDKKNPFVQQIAKRVEEADRAGDYEKYGYLRKTFIEFLDSFARTAKIDFGYDSMKAMQMLAAMAAFLDLGKGEVPPEIGQLFGQISPRAKDIEPCTAKVLEASIKGMRDYTALPNGLECALTQEGDYKEWIESLGSSGKIVLVLGKRGSGKSALAFKLAEYANAAQKRPVFAVGFPEDKAGLLPNWIAISHEPESCDEGAFMLVDEAGIQYLSYNYKSQENQLINQLMQITRHKGQLMVYTTQNGASVDKNIVRQSDSIIFKMPGLMQKETDRPEFRRWTLEAGEFFNSLEKEERKATAVIRDNEFYGAVRFELPGFWSEGLSRAWNSYNLS